MTVQLIDAQDVSFGDLMECADKSWRVVRKIERQGNRLYFLFGRALDTRSAVIGDFVAVGR